MSNLPVLHVVLPLIAAAICALFKDGKKSFNVALLTTWACFFVAISISALVGREGSTTYDLGGWPAPVGIEYRIDELNSFVILLLTFVGSIMVPYAKKSIESELPKEKHSLFYSMYLLCFAGLLGIVSTNDLFNIYVFLEISSLSTYTLIAMGKDRQALTASFQYLVLGTIGATFILIGIGLLYMMTGTLNILDMSTLLGDVADPRPIQAAFAFLTLGLALKIAMFPLHIWLTNAYCYSPSFVSAFLASTATKVSLYVFIRVIYTLFGIEYSFGEMPLSLILVVLGVAGVLVGSLTAIFQHNVKRMLGFSSIAQLGYISLGLALATNTGLTAAILHMGNHALAKGALFLCVGAVYYRMGNTKAEYFKGIAKKMPYTMAAFVIAGFSLIGIPGTAGFISKWYFFKALVEEGWWAALIVMLASSIMAVIYIWRIIEKAYFEKPLKTARAKKVKEAPLALLIPIWILALANLYFGVFTEFSLGLASQAASSLMAGF